MTGTDTELRADTDTVGATWMMAAAAVLIGIGGVADDPSVATVLIIVALAAAVVALLDPGARVLTMLGTRSVVTVLAVGITLEAITQPTRAPIPHVWYATALLVLTAIGLHALLFAERWRFRQLVIVVAGHFVVMAWMISVAGAPDIDVYVFQQEGAAALLSGKNPFAQTFDIAVTPGSPFYAPDVIEGGRLNFGFIYPPVSLLMALPGYAIAGDYRYGAAAAIALAALLIGAVRPTRLATGGALLLLFAPMTQQVLYWGWTDPFVILILAATLYLAVRNATTTPVGLGLLIASKQYMAPLLLLGAVLLRAVRGKVGPSVMLSVPVAVAVITVLPFVLWDATAFTYSTLTVHLLQPFRVDSLSVPALIVRAGGPEIPSAAAFIVAGGALAFVLWRAARTPAGFCVGAAVVLIAFFLFSKQAFFHYYFLALAALACGIAATGVEQPRTTASLG